MGRVLIAGGNPSMAVPVPGIPAGDLAVGSSVYLLENGTAVEYLVVNQGKPSSSSLYDDSCNGTWLLRKDIYETRVWHSSAVNAYASSDIHSYLNSTFLGLFNRATQAQIRQVKIPYCVGNGSTTVNSGANGLTAKIFLLASAELGTSASGLSYLPADGAYLSNFGGTSIADSKRIAYLNGTATNWWTRSPNTYDTSYTWDINTTGQLGSAQPTNKYGIRPALVLPSTATFDQSTLVLKGGA